MISFTNNSVSLLLLNFILKEKKCCFWHTGNNLLLNWPVRRWGVNRLQESAATFTLCQCLVFGQSYINDTFPALTNESQRCCQADGHIIFSLTNVTWDASSQQSLVVEVKEALPAPHPTVGNIIKMTTGPHIGHKLSNMIFLYSSAQNLTSHKCCNKTIIYLLFINYLLPF